LQLVLLEAEVEHAQPYGVPGDAQAGIDIYARISESDKYQTFQCKRVKVFSASHIKAAVKKFRKGPWLDKSEQFILCTNQSMANKKRANEIEFQSRLLKRKGISFITWDSLRLNTKLKKLPEIVDDFFGRDWVREFCGEEHADALKKRNRLDVEQIKEFRIKMRAFYTNLFSLHDPGLPGASLLGMGSPPLTERYIYSDIETTVVASSSSEVDVESTLIEIGEIRSEAPVAEQKAGSHHGLISYKQRQSFGKWLSESSRSVILGAPGSGKSTLLHFIALDLLEESPRLDEIAVLWGHYLPVWVPFGRWTKKLKDVPSDDWPLEELIHRWLIGLSEESLWPVIEQALNDERLLLLVDGLDEWASEAAAQQALQTLLLFIKQRNIPAILTSRVYGFERLGMPTESWQCGHLADFSIDQQNQLASYWISRHVEMRSQSPAAPAKVGEYVRSILDSFNLDLNRSGDLRELAKTPLLLCLLIAFKLQNMELPPGRFEVYEKTIQHLVTDHPMRRRTAASLMDSSLDLSPKEIQSVFACLALHIQEGRHWSGIAIEEAQIIVQEFLIDSNNGLGYPAPQARRLAEELIKIGDESTGLLTEPSPNHVGLFHRAFAEYLAAVHVSRKGFEEQLTIVTNRCGDPQWRELILCLFSLTKRPVEITQFVEAIQQVAGTGHSVDNYATSALLSEVAFGPFDCPPELARKLASTAFDEIATESWMPHRQQLLNAALNGLRSSSQRKLVQQQIRNWFPCHLDYRGNLYLALGAWNRSEETEECLRKGLYDEIFSNRRAAATAYAEMWGGEDAAGDRLLELALRAVDPDTRAAALEGLIQGWPSHALLPQAIDEAFASLYPALRFMGVIGHISQGRQQKEDQEALMELMRRESNLNSHFFWHGDVVKAFLDGWPRSEEIKRNFLENFINADGRETFDIFDHDAVGVALGVLLQGYPQDDQIAEFVAGQLRLDCVQRETKDYTTRQFLRELHGKEFQWLWKNFQGHPKVVAAIGDWMRQAPSYHRSYIAPAALVGRTSVDKQQLLALIETEKSQGIRGIFSESLLEGWGMEDPEVAVALEAAATGSTAVASSIAHLIPRIITDQSACRQRLLEILAAPDCNNVNNVLAGLEKLGSTQGDQEVLDIFFQHDIEFICTDERYKGAIPRLVTNYSSDFRIKAVALRQIEEITEALPFIARAYKDDSKMREQILKLSLTLPALLRRAIAKRVSEGTGDEEFDFKLLSLYDHEPDGAAKVEASIGYYTRIKKNKTDIEPLLPKLRSELGAHMPYAMEGRAASYAGLLILERLDVAVDYVKNSTENNRFYIPLAEFRLNEPFARLLFENWKTHKTALGENAWKYHVSSPDNDYEHSQFWEGVLALADEYSAVREEALTFLRGKNSLGGIGDTNSLRFFARAYPKSSALLNHCLNHLYSGGRSMYTAAELLGLHFGGDDEVLRKILGEDLPALFEKVMCDGNSPQLEYSQELAMRITQEQIMALCEGWPGSAELEYIFHIARSQKWKLDNVVAFALMCRKSGSDVVITNLRNLLSDFSTLDRYGWESPSIVRAVNRRVATDEQLAEQLMKLLLGHATPSEKATLPKLIQNSPTIVSEARNWCHEELTRQVDLTSTPEIGFDLTVNELRPVAHSLLDVLMKSQF
jgi:hypothetical protein